MRKIKWIRPSGSEIETNDLEATVDHCVRLGWKPAKTSKKKVSKKKAAKRNN